MASGAPDGKLAAFQQTALGRNLMLCAAVLVIAAVMIAVGIWSQQPDYRVLFANYSDRDGGAIVAALQQMNVPYKFAEGGGAILVPSTSVHDVRLRLATQGLPKGGNVGFELMENQKLGVSQFLEQVNFQRALEGELATSIQSISAVQAARVHLALPKSSVFVREQQKPTASILINLYPGRSLDRQQLSGIVHLVSSSVPDLPPANVAVIDQNGTLLSDNNKTGPHNLDPTQLRYVDELQQSIVKRIESIIAPIMGDKNVRAEVTADIDFSNVESANETYQPNQAPNAPAVRSLQTAEQLDANGAAAAGVPGSLSNQPPVPATAPLTTPAAGAAPGSAAPGAVPLHKESTTNYEVDKTIKYVRQAVGGIKRLSVAVVVNYKLAADKSGKNVPRPLTEDEKTQITTLAKEAMGFNAERGDTINVVNSPFAGMEKELIVEPGTLQKLQSFALANAVEIGKYVVGALVLLYLFFGVMRPLLRKMATPAPSAAREVADPETPPPSGPTPRSYQQKLDIAKQLAKDDPRVVANVMKKWVDANE